MLILLHVFQGTLIALVSLSQSKLLDMVNSAALLSPIAHLGQVTSSISQAAAKAFIAEVKHISIKPIL